MIRTAARMILPVAAISALLATAGAGAKLPVAYCNVNTKAAQAWGFHTGTAITGATGSFAHGHGGFAGHTASGQICQVDRVRGAADRQIILNATQGYATSLHAVTRGGTTGNFLKFPVRVKSSTDKRCKVGTLGTVTLFAGFNGVHKDTVRLSFPKACRSHNHLYTGPKVVVLVPHGY